MKFIPQLRAIVWKDFISEFRTKEMILFMCLFSFLVLMIFNFAFDVSIDADRGMTAGLLWVAFVFSGLTGLGRSFSVERDRGTFQGLILSPVSPWTIFLAKLISVFVFTTFMEIITLFLFSILYNTTIFPFLVPLGLIVFLGTVGFTAIGTIFSAISATTRTRDVLLSILFFPISVPVIIASVKATGIILNGMPFQTVIPWLKILVGFDLIFLLVSYLTFEFITEE
ncbi:MAG: heme exporter protein CcmB [Desulfobacterales bacterium]